jgi:hypothetical protein
MGQVHRKSRRICLTRRSRHLHDNSTPRQIGSIAPTLAGLGLIVKAALLRKGENRPKRPATEPGLRLGDVRRALMGDSLSPRGDN